MVEQTFEQLVREALAAPFEGWDFSWLKGRWQEAPPPWSYRDLVEARLPAATALLDMGTGGGEFLASLSNLPETTYATEAYVPNISVAEARLAPLGVTVVPVEEDGRLPLPSECVDLVINRHEYYDPAAVFRVLKPGGSFLTQQVGARDCVQLNQYLDAPVGPDAVTWEFWREVDALAAVGFDVAQSQEALVETRFLDIGAVVYYLRVIEWQIPGFSVERYDTRLRALHRLLERDGAFFAASHRYLIDARKPE